MVARRFVLALVCFSSIAHAEDDAPYVPPDFMAVISLEPERRPKDNNAASSMDIGKVNTIMLGKL